MRLYETRYIAGIVLPVSKLGSTLDLLHAKCTESTHSPKYFVRLYECSLHGPFQRLIIPLKKRAIKNRKGRSKFKKISDLPKQDVNTHISVGQGFPGHFADLQFIDTVGILVSF